MEAEHIWSAAKPEQFPAPSLPEIAFLGRSNVGKSSLLNCLTGKRGLARTSTSPGRTQAIHFYRVDGKWHFVDLPGYGYARVPLELKSGWKRLIEEYLQHRKTLLLAVVLLDTRRGWMEKDLELKQWLEFYQVPYVVVATKVDKLNRQDQQSGLKAIGKELESADMLFPFSALTGQGAREIWQAISKTRNNRH